MARVKIVASVPGSDPYAVRIGSGVIQTLGDSIREAPRCGQVKRIALLQDSHVASLYGARVKATLLSAGYAVSEISLPQGEAAKSIEVASEVWEALSSLNFTRTDACVALGGGAMCDACGFIAATYMRGMPAMYVPTTLLACVDAAIGGKTALNCASTKNLIGTVTQPVHVCMDTDVFATLDEDMWACGLAEAAKLAALTSDEFWFWTIDHAQELRARDENAVRDLIARAVVAKTDCVAADPYDTAGIRAKLNYGHTLGHALEALSLDEDTNCDGDASSVFAPEASADVSSESKAAIAHGIAVAAGMRFAARLGVAVAGTSMDFVYAQDELLDALGIPQVECTFGADELIAVMRRDKKNAAAVPAVAPSAGAIRFILPTDVGAYVARDVDYETLSAHLAAWLKI